MMRRFVISMAAAVGSLAATAANAAEPDNAIGPVAIAAGAETAATDMSVAAAEHSSSHEANDTEVIFTPYLWVAGINGEVGVPRGDGEAEIDKSFADILGDLNFAFMGALDIRHKRFVAIGDLMYLNVSADVETVDSPVFVEGEVDTALLVATAAAGYRVVDNGPMFVDLFAGVRVVSVDVEVELTGPLQTREREVSPTSVSGLVGGRVRVPLGEKWALALYGDIGDIFGDSDIKWQLLGTVQRDLGSNWRMALGYRYAAVNHEGEDLKLDIGLSGPILGISYKF